MKYNVEIDIPQGKYCGDCQMVDAEFSEYCHLLGEKKTLKSDSSCQYLKDKKCPGYGK